MEDHGARPHAGAVPFLLRAGLIAGVLLVGPAARADVPVTFQAPHVARLPAASMDEALARSVDERIKVATITATPELLRFALDVAAADLHFGLSHPTSLRFGTTEREGNCIEYAHLFATVFNRAAASKRVAARAWVVHSDARVLGQKLPMRGLDDHDWVLVVPSDPKEKRLFVDPTFYDFGLDWDITSKVSGVVKIP